MNARTGFSRWHLGQELASDVDAAAPDVAPPTPHDASAARVQVALLVLALMYTMYFAKPVLVPIVLAAVLATCLAPMVDALDRMLPRWLAVSVVMFLLCASLYWALSTLWAPAHAWLVDAPRALPQLSAKLASVARAAADASGASALESAGVIDTDAGIGASITLWTALSEAPQWLTQAFSVLLLTFFFSLHGGALLRRLVELSPTLSRKKQVVGIVRAIQGDTARYFLITSCINLLLGTATALAMWALGVREPLLWGAMVALFNFVPYLGALVSILILALVGLLQFDSIGAGLTPALVFLTLATLEGQFLSPTVLGQRLSLSPVAILLWLLLWGWLWGVPGVLLGVPMLMCLKLTCERLLHWRWLARAVE